MDSVELGISVENKYVSHRPSWWSALKWKRILFYFGVALFLYDLAYCVVVFYYVKALNSNPDFRLVVYKTNSRFMKLYYTLHYYLGDPSLQDTDAARWLDSGEF